MWSTVLPLSPHYSFLSWTKLSPAVWPPRGRANMSVFRAQVQTGSDSHPPEVLLLCEWWLYVTRRSVDTVTFTIPLGSHALHSAVMTLSEPFICDEANMSSLSPRHENNNPLVFPQKYLVPNMRLYKILQKLPKASNPLPFLWPHSGLLLSPTNSNWTLTWDLLGFVLSLLFPWRVGYRS